jgi:hypothetical protein
LGQIWQTNGEKVGVGIERVLKATTQNLLAKILFRHQNIRLLANFFTLVVQENNLPPRVPLTRRCCFLNSCAMRRKSIFASRFC